MKYFNLLVLFHVIVVVMLACTPQDSNIASFFPDSVQYWDSRIGAWSEEHDVLPNVLATIMYMETCGDWTARSHAGAMGLFQVMPYWFSGIPTGLEDLKGKDSYNVHHNVRAATTHMRSCRDYYGGWNALSFGCYNNVRSWERKQNIPMETKRYSYWASRIYNDTISGSSNNFDNYHKGKTSYCARAERRLGIE